MIKRCRFKEIAPSATRNAIINSGTPTLTKWHNVINLSEKSWLQLFAAIAAGPVISHKNLQALPFREQTTHSQTTRAKKTRSQTGSAKPTCLIYQQKSPRWGSLQAFYLERPQSSNAQGSFSNKLLAASPGIFDFVDSSITVWHFKDNIFSTPLPEAEVVEIDDGAYRELSH